MRSSFVLVLASLVLVTACEDDDTVAPPLKKDAGGGTVDATIEGGAGVDAAIDPNSLCAKYGGYSKVENLVKASIAAVASDCKIGAFFSGLSQTQNVHLQDCLSKQVGEFMGCRVTYAGSTDSLGKECRTMAEAHQDIDPQIRQADFDAFIIDVTSTLKTNGMSTDDIAKIAPSFLSTSQEIVQSADQGFSNSICPGQDAGADARDGSAITDGNAEGG